MLESPWLRKERREELWASCGGWRRGDRGSPGEDQGRRLRLLNWLESLWSGGEACKAQAVTQQRRPQPLFLRCCSRSLAGRELIGIVDEVAAGTVRAEANGVECATWLCLVLGVPAEASQLIQAVGKLALGAILAGPTFLIGAAEFSLVPGGDVGGWGWGTRGRRGSSGGKRGVADAEAWWRKQKLRGYVSYFVLSASHSTDVAFDHAD